MLDAERPDRGQSQRDQTLPETGSGRPLERPAVPRPRFDTSGFPVQAPPPPPPWDTGSFPIAVPPPPQDTGGLPIQAPPAPFDTGSFAAQNPPARRDTGSFAAQRPSTPRYDTSGFPAQAPPTPRHTGGFPAQNPPARYETGGFPAQAPPTPRHTGGFPTQRPSSPRYDTSGFPPQTPPARYDTGGFPAQNPPARRDTGSFPAQNLPARYETGGFPAQNPPARYDTGGFPAQRPSTPRYDTSGFAVQVPPAPYATGEIPLVPAPSGKYADAPVADDLDSPYAPPRESSLFVPPPNRSWSPPPPAQPRRAIAPAAIEARASAVPSAPASTAKRRSGSGPRHARPRTRSVGRIILMIVLSLAAIATVIAAVTMTYGAPPRFIGDLWPGSRDPGAPAAPPQGQQPGRQPDPQPGTGAGGPPPSAPQPGGKGACGKRGVVPANPAHGALIAQRCVLRPLDRYGQRIPVFEGRGSDTRIVGWINQADDRHWFVGEARGGRYADGGAANTNWAYTQADNAAWGWMPGTFFAVGSSRRGDPTLAACGDRCRPY